MRSCASHEGRSRVGGGGAATPVSTIALTTPALRAIPRHRTAPRVCRRVCRTAWSALPARTTRGTRPRAGASPRWRPRPPVVGAGPGCVPPPRRLSVPRRTRPGAAPSRTRAGTEARLCPWSVVPPRRERRTSHGRGRAGSGRQARTAPTATGLDDRPPASGSHTRPEAVALLALPVVRLERALHAWPPREGNARGTRGEGPGRSGAKNKSTARSERTATRPRTPRARPHPCCGPSAVVRFALPRRRHGLGGELPRMPRPNLPAG